MRHLGVKGWDVISNKTMRAMARISSIGSTFVCRLVLVAMMRLVPLIQEPITLSREVRLDCGWWSYSYLDNERNSLIILFQFEQRLNGHRIPGSKRYDAIYIR